MKIVIIAAIIIGMFLSAWFIVNDFHKNAYRDVKSPRKCIVIDKQVRQYNAASESRRVDLQYKNTFIVQYENRVFDIDVTEGTYYAKEIGDTVYFSLSINDLNGFEASGWVILASIAFVVLLVCLIAQIFD